MLGNPPPNDPRSLWQSQTEGGQPMPEMAANISDQARTWERRFHVRNIREYIGLALIVVIFGGIAWNVYGRPLTFAGSLLIVAAALWGAYRIRARGTYQSAPLGATTAEYVAHLREELERQRDLLRSIGRWYNRPYVPGVILTLLGAVLERPHASSGPLHAWVVAGIAALACAAVFVGIALLNRAAARLLQRRIDALTMGGSGEPTSGSPG